jgi:AbrB family looped-hinge helix DNA binding protein
MYESKVTSKGQITIPKAVREALAVYAGDRVRFVIHDDATVTVEAETVDLTSLRGVVKRAGRRVSLEDMQDAIARGAADR